MGIEGGPKDVQVDIIDATEITRRVYEAAAGDNISGWGEQSSRLTENDGRRNRRRSVAHDAP
jgi:hypothetical protein